MVIPIISMHLLEVKLFNFKIMPIGLSRECIWSKKTSNLAIGYTLIRWEGWASSSGGTPGDANSSVYEIYIFTNGYIELRIGTWNLAGSGISGHYNSSGTGVAFPLISGSSLTQNVNYLWDATGTNPTIYLDSQYVDGSIVSGSSVAPSLGAGPAASWTPSGWTSLQNASADDAYVTVPITSTTIMGTLRSNAYVGSNAYITFGGGSTLYSGLSTTSPALDKFMFNAADRSYLRVAYITGSK